MRDRDVLELTALLDDAGFDDTAKVLTVALDADQALVALSIQDREAILRTLTIRLTSCTRRCSSRYGIFGGAQRRFRVRRRGCITTSALG